MSIGDTKENWWISVASLENLLGIGADSYVSSSTDFSQMCDLSNYKLINTSKVITSSAIDE